MPTPFSSIYTKANILFEDAQLLTSLTDEEYSQLLELFLSKAKSLYFKNCKKDLTDIDGTLKQFNEDLNNEEEWVLAEGIKLVWLERKLNKEEMLRDKIGNKDYTNHSPGNLIQKLTDLVKESRQTLKDYTIEYSFDGFTGFN